MSVGITRLPSGAAATRAAVAAAIGAALAATAVRRAAQSSRVALVGGRLAAAVRGAAAGGIGRAVDPGTLVGRSRTDLAEAVAIAAVAVLLAGVTIGSAGAWPVSAFAASTTVAAVGVPAVMLAVATFPPVGVLPPLDAVAWALRFAVGKRESSQCTGDWQSGNERDEMPPATDLAEGTRERVEAGRIHATSSGRCLPGASREGASRIWTLTGRIPDVPPGARCGQRKQTRTGILVGRLSREE